ncbi:NUDIX hydrolase [Paenibacillus guangzhouensis]|uniref:NUDIX hydrolase n=1 Tax=Paenibacillus guangzhouensis TaxID=1473112 RepID=UPI001266D359|nr:8-oxo-dGTP diphosphatase [Paenibacillus guangzhouensis]
MLKYNICFMKRGEEILLLNREKSSWMGCWNGIGGKLEANETIRASMIREIREETGIEIDHLQFKGMITWTVDEESFGGMYVYMAEVPVDFEYVTPIRTDEGILDWKKISWIVHPENHGIATNIPHTLPMMLKDAVCYDHHCMYEGSQLREMVSHVIDARMEYDDHLLHEYLSQHGHKQFTMA